MQIRNRLLAFLMILIFVFSISGMSVFAASEFSGLDTDPESEIVTETADEYQNTELKETESVEERKQAIETEQAIDTDSAGLTETIMETEAATEKESVMETELQQETETTEEETTETETEVTKEEVKGYAGISLAGSGTKRLLKKAAANTAQGTAQLRDSSYICVSAIDISELNTITDWSKIRESGVECVIIRVAGRYYGSGKFYTDDDFAVNVQNAKKAGLQVGAYFFSQALNEKEAIEEADLAAQLMDPYKSSITLPVYMDYEWDSSAYRLYKGGTVAQRTATVKAFMTEIKKKGYTAGLYSSDNILGNYLDCSALSELGSIWIAHWADVVSPGYSYSGVYDCWQYSSTGTVPGIEGAVDLDYYYMPASVYYTLNENVKGKDGIYIISSVADPGHALEVGSDGNLVLGNYTGANNQRFIVTSDSAGRYQITSFLNGKVFDCQSGGTESGTNIRSYKKNQTIAQTWLLQKAGSNTFYITSYKSGKKIYADTDGNIVLADQGYNKEYEFILNSVSTDSVTEGFYEISCASSSSFVLDIKGASTADKANCQIYKRNGTNAQKFYIEKTSDGYYRIMNARSGKVLDVSGGSTEDCANIQQYSANDTDAQKWILLLNEDGSYSLFSKKSKKSISVQNDEFTSTENVYQVSYSGSAGQKFKLTKKNTASGAPVSEGKYYIVSAGDPGYCIAVGAGLRTDSANVILYKKLVSAAQQFIFVYQGNGYYNIINDKSGKVLDVAGGSTSNKANIQQYHTNGTDAQIWKVQKNSDGTYTFRNKKSFKCIDVAGAKFQSNINIWQYNSNGSKEQRFYLKQE